LRLPKCIITLIRMFTRRQWRKFLDNPVVEWAMFLVGMLLIVISPILGPIPGPGGLPIFVAGLALVLKSSIWAKRHYARLKKKRVRFRGKSFIVGDWTDWALRRRSARRRKAIRKAREAGGGN